MNKNIKLQLKIAICSSGFLSMFVIMVIFSLVSFVLSCISELGNDITSVTSAEANFFLNGAYNSVSVKIFSIIMPFAACAAFSDSYVADYNDNRLSIILARSGEKKYYFSKMITVFLCGSIVIFLPQILNFLLCCIAFPINSTNEYGWDLWQSHLYDTDYLVGSTTFLFKRLYISSPYLYFILYMVISSSTAGVMAIISYQLSFFIRNRVFTISFMFILLNLAGMLPYLQSFNIEYYIYGCYVGGDTPIYFIITSAIYIVIALIPTPFALKRLKNCL